VPENPETGEDHPALEIDLSLGMAAQSAGRDDARLLAFMEVALPEPEQDGVAVAHLVVAALDA